MPKLQYLIRSLAIACLLPVVFDCVGDSPAIGQTQESVPPPAILSQGSPESPAFTRWKEITRQWRETQRQLGNQLSNMTLLVPDEQNTGMAQIEQTRNQLNALKIQMLAAAADGYLESPKDNPLLGRDALTHLRVLMGEDEEIAIFNPAQAHDQASRMLTAGSKDPQIHYVALRAAVAIENFEMVQKHLAELELLGLKPNQPYLDQLASLERGWQRELEFRQRDATASLPVVRIETSLGVIMAELFEDDAPNTVNSFVSLVERGYYNNQEFFNVQPGFLAFAGCPNGDGSGAAEYAIPEETGEPTAREHFAGSLTSFHTPGKPVSSLYSISWQPVPIRNGEHTVFGRVIEGLDVLYQIPAFSPTDRLIDKKAVKIISVTMLKKRDHEYSPSKTIPLDSVTPVIPGSIDSIKTETPPGGGGG